MALVLLALNQSKVNTVEDSNARKTVFAYHRLVSTDYVLGALLLLLEVSAIISLELIIVIVHLIHV